MTALTVWRFNTPDGAEAAVETLEHLAGKGLVTIHDAATVSWEPDRKKPKTRQLHETTRTGALAGAFWGMLFGLIFFLPVLGLAIGAAGGALSGAMTDVGIDDGFIDRVRAEITPGTSALFVMTSDAVIDKVKEGFAGQDPRLIFTNLSGEQESRLHEVFGD
ncbi:DUF1269 domain-containing protein [Nocardioidaceae bacterium SCSIO 66511]|nr:DUF1269 domain-containing protein [Nocardioidaceae bacterium SCSIO 66511]